MTPSRRPDELGRKIAVALSKYSSKQAPHAAPPAPKQGEIRIVHALQPAPHFHGRDLLVKELTDWVADLASPDRVWSLVAAGGTGKTAVAERVVRDMRPGEASVLVWSFYEKPDADAFLRECNQLFLGEDEGPAGGRLERLERGLRDGRPHLIVLDGLERVQEDAGSGRVRGELSDQTLKLLLRALAAGLGRARALVTSRFPLVDLQDWTNRGYRDTRLDDLTPEAALAVLRGWGVVGDDAALGAAAHQVGYHALSVAVIGSYLHSFASGRIEEVASFDLDAVTGEDPKAAKLARVLAFYAERLPPEERELLARLSVFPRGVTLELLGTLIDAGGEVAGLLVKAKPRLVKLLNNLKARGLVFEYRGDTSVTWTAHPFLRERFRGLLGCPAEKVFDVVAQGARRGAGGAAGAQAQRSDLARSLRAADRGDAARGAGAGGVRFVLVRDGGLPTPRLAARRLPARLPDPGGFQRDRTAGGPRADDGTAVSGRSSRALSPSSRSPSDAWRRRGRSGRWMTPGRSRSASARRCRPGSRTRARWRSHAGAWPSPARSPSAALIEAEAAEDRMEKKHSLAFRANAAHALGDIPAAQADFASAMELEGQPLYSLRGS